jgi:hypothetical protein
MPVLLYSTRTYSFTLHGNINFDAEPDLNPEFNNVLRRNMINSTIIVDHGALVEFHDLA